MTAIVWSTSFDMYLGMRLDKIFSGLGKIYLMNVARFFATEEVVLSSQVVASGQYTMNALTSWLTSAVTGRTTKYKPERRSAFLEPD